MCIRDREDVLLAPGNVIVRAVSEANSIPGVPVRVYLENFLDQMVFSQGTVLAAGTWDPHSGMEIDLVILQLLNQANNAALNAGVALSPERRGAVLLPGNYFFDAIEASRAIKQPVEIRLVVAEDSWRSTSPVLLYLEKMCIRDSSRTEASLCQEAGLDVEFVGHPLMDLADRSATPEQAREKLGLALEGKVVAVLPGPREVEVKNVLPPVLKALCQVTQDHPELQVLISLAPTIRTTLVEEILGSNPCANVRLERDTYRVLSAADAAITSIGTASLEASLLGVPSLAVYRVPRATYFAEKILDRKPYMSITNKILRRNVIPEFIQGHVNHQKIAKAVEQLLYDEKARQEMLTALSQLEEELGEPGAVERAVRVVIEMAGCGNDGTTRG